MFGRGVIRELDSRRLRVFLSLFLCALLIPTGFLIWQAYTQLKWEAFHQYRGMAEELTNRLDARVTRWIATAEARSFADYSFLVVTGEPSANVLQRSALSSYPPSGEIPGLMGYFQVDMDGGFTTPMLPAGSKTAESYGISNIEYRERQALADRIRVVLSENRLVEDRLNEAIERQDLDSQMAFDDLKALPAGTRSPAAESNNPQALMAEAEESPERDTNLGRVADLNLNAAYQKRSADLEQAQQSATMESAKADYGARATRKEKISLALPAASAVQASGTPDEVLRDTSDLRISTFESEIDPLEFSLLNSGHFVLFRKVWRDGERYIQGMVVDQRPFIQESVDIPFRQTALSAMSNLFVAHQDNVLHTVSSDNYENYVDTANELDGALLYRNRLSAPLDSIELIYSVRYLPPGPGAGLLGWVSLVLGLVFCGGFYALYRVGLSQISLARQQQDFVSAVSHEMKTPLTSIRMYGEMLMNGWAPEDKKQMYYEFIHDESERLTRLISNVLQLANISRSGPQLELKPVAVAQVLAAIESKIVVQVEHTDFEILFRSDADPVIVNIDQDCFTQIIINLVDNAIKFSRGAQRKRIEISAELLGSNRVVFAVRDFGPGIAKDQMRKIFDMFYRSESELTRETVGTGIGLAIVHQLSVAMDAEVDVLNREPGAEFRVTVPIAQ